jgi:hypothetical protein
MSRPKPNPYTEDAEGACTGYLRYPLASFDKVTIDDGYDEMTALVQNATDWHDEVKERGRIAFRGPPISSNLAPFKWRNTRALIRLFMRYGAPG